MMLEFDELFKLVYQNKSIRGMNLKRPELLYYRLLRLFADYSKNKVNASDASVEKEEIKKAYEAECKQYQKQADILSEYQKNIKRAGTLRAEIYKAQNQEEKLLLALECIEKMTGEAGLKKRNMRVV